MRIKLSGPGSLGFACLWIDIFANRSILVTVFWQTVLTFLDHCMRDRYKSKHKSPPGAGGDRDRIDKVCAD